MLRLLTLSTIAAFFFLSCQKELSTDNPDPIPPKLYSSVESFFEQNQQVPQDFTIKAATGGICEGKLGGKFHFAPGIFVDKNGNAPTGDIKISIREIYSAGDMILNKMPTTSDGKLLSSGGEFHISAKANGEELFVKKGSIVKIDLPGKALDGMQVFNGQITPTGEVNWVLNTNQANTVRRRDSIMVGGDPVYSLFCDSIQWINCDKFINDTKISCKFRKGNCPDTDSTELFVHLTGRNSVIRLNPDAQGDFNTNQLIAANATIVAICYTNGKFNVANMPLALTNNLDKSLVFTEMKEEEIKATLKALK